MVCRRHSTRWPSFYFPSICAPLKIWCVATVRLILIAPTLTDVMHVPHRRHFDYSMLVTCLQERYTPLPQTCRGALGSWFFPGTDEFRASTISSDDQASRLNRVQAAEENKGQASRRLGAVVRIVGEPSRFNLSYIRSPLRRPKQKSL